MKGILALLFLCAASHFADGHHFSAIHTHRGLLGAKLLGMTASVLSVIGSAYSGPMDLHPESQSLDVVNKASDLEPGLVFRDSSASSVAVSGGDGGKATAESSASSGGEDGQSFARSSASSGGGGGQSSAGSSASTGGGGGESSAESSASSGGEDGQSFARSSASSGGEGGQSSAKSSASSGGGISQSLAESISSIVKPHGRSNSPVCPPCPCAAGGEVGREDERGSSKRRGFSTPNRLEYRFFPALGGDINFQVKASNDAHIALTAGPEEDDPIYEVFLGGWENTKSVIRKNKSKPYVAERETPDILSSDEYRGFWIKWTDGMIAVGMQGEETPFMTHEDEELFPVGFVGFSTVRGASGSWVVEGIGEPMQ